jgi:hypothetical protein
VTRDDDDLRDLPARIYGERRYFLPEWRKRRQKEIDNAVAIINPQPRQREACREDVEREGMRLFVGVGMKRFADKSKTKEGKVAIGRLAKVLRRLEIVLKDENLDGVVAAAAVTRHISPEQIADGIDCCKEIQKARTTGPLVRKDAEAKRRAVHCAHALLTKYNKREAGKATAGSPFCKLAALLYGKPEVDLHNQCRAALRKKRGAK